MDKRVHKYSNHSTENLLKSTETGFYNISNAKNGFDSGLRYNKIASYSSCEAIFVYTHLKLPKNCQTIHYGT